MVSLKERLTEILIHNKLITQAQLDKALEAQKSNGGRLSDIIIALNFIKEGDLISSLSQGLGLPLIDLKRLKLDHELAKTISVDIARHYQIIPISKMGDNITLAMADPLNIFAVDYVGLLTGYKINPVIASSKDILQAIELTYPDLTKSIVEDLVSQMQEESIELIREVQLVSPSAQELDKVTRQAPVIKVTNMILQDALSKKASDILIEPLDKKMRIRFRIDGILQELPGVPSSMHAAIVSRIKVLSDLDIAEHRLPQDGRFKVSVFSKQVDFRVSVLPSTFGEKVALRILDKSGSPLDIEKLGFSLELVDKLKKASASPHGMLLVCGPTGCGKTTTLYSILKFVDSPEKNIVTVEDPVEYQLEGINQVTARPEIGLSFAAALRSILRQDPNVIMVGEIRDLETVDIAIKSALTGHLVLSTLHTTTAAAALVRLINMGVEPYLINASLVCVLAQRLVRRLCGHCKESYSIKKEVLENLKLDFKISASQKFFRAKGCPHCLNTGYSARLGIAECLILTPAIRELVLKHSQEHLIKEKACAEGMKALREDGLRLVSEGLTTLEEVLRVT